MARIHLPNLPIWLTTINILTSGLYENPLKNKAKTEVIMICENCKKEHDGSYGSGRFCSRSCANTRNRTLEVKEKTSKSLKLKYIEYEKKNLICNNCKKIYHTKDFSRKLCYDCLPSTIKKVKIDKQPKTIKDLSSRTISKIVKRMNLPCTCCGFYVEGIVLDFHHIIRRADNGTNDLNNLTYICPNCHRIAHNDETKLVKPLVSIEQYLKDNNLDWTSFYYGYTESGDN